MRRSALIQFRLEPELKDKLKKKGDMSAYLRSLVEEDLGLSNGDAGVERSSESQERTDQPSGVSVAEPRSSSERAGPFDGDDPTLVRQKAEAQKAAEQGEYKVQVKAGSAVPDAFDNRVEELARTMPRSSARRLATQELHRKASKA